MACQMCKERVKYWSGDDPECAFESGVFSSGNWNCATVSAIRGICYEGQSPMPDGVDCRYCNDDKYATIYTGDVAGLGDGDRLAYALWVQWYKTRGRTKQMFLLTQDGPRRPTEDECRKIIESYSNA